MTQTMRIDEDFLDDAANRELLHDPNITFECDRCGAKLDVLHLAATQDDKGRAPIHLVKCSANERHFSVHFHHRS